MRKTVLNAVHQAMGAKMVEFGGWHMPVAYSQIRDEHRATRTAAGLFDLSHMGRFIVRGKDRVALIDRVATNDIAAMKPGEAGYGLLCDEGGKTQDDIITYVFPEHLLVVVNAGNRDRDWALIDGARASSGLDCTLENASERLAMLAVQGPRAIEVCKQFTSDPVGDLGYYHALEGTFAGVPATIARTGYTGEDGLELYFPAEHAERIWKAILEGGKAAGLLPIGLGARDTLRLEAAMPLYGHELTLETDPLEAGLGFAVKLKKKADFTGKAALAAAKERGPARKLVCIACEGKKIPREGHAVKRGGEVVGKVTSGTFSPTFERPICMAYVAPGAAEVGTDVEVDVRGEALPGKVVKRPFYKRAN
ncbi:MAG TPA: glycine cleavage system aminomethyltransferase GcvT [Planctomycetota bacterium]|nr:glycine cleavage system aminomethyltransferase GcvT [Planctomycetota bacterium]